MRGLDLTKVNKEIWDGCPLLPRGPPDRSSQERPCTLCDVDSDLSDTSSEEGFSGSDFNSSEGSSNQLSELLPSDASDDEGSGHFTEPSLKCARDCFIEKHHREALPRMESQRSRIPLPGGGTPREAKTPEPLHDAPRDWASILHVNPKHTGIPRPREKAPCKPYERLEPKTGVTGVTKAYRGRKSPLATGSIPRRLTTQTEREQNGVPLCLLARVPRLNFGGQHRNQDVNSEGHSAQRQSRTSFDDSSCAFGADDLSQVSSLHESELASEMPSEIPSDILAELTSEMPPEILAEMASEMPSEIPLMEPKRTPRSVRLAKLTAQDQAAKDGGEHLQDSDDTCDDQNSVSQEDGIGSPFLQGMGYLGKAPFDSMHALLASDGNGSPYLQGPGCSGSNSGAASDFDVREGMGVEEDQDVPLGHLSSDGSDFEERLSENQWELSDSNPQYSQGEDEGQLYEVDLGDFNDLHTLDRVDDWREKRLHYTEQTSGEDESDCEQGHKPSLVLQSTNEHEGCNHGTFHEKADSEESLVLWENSSRLSNIADKSTQSLRSSVDEELDAAPIGLKKSMELHTSIELTPGVHCLAPGPAASPGVLPFEAPFQTRDQEGQDLSREVPKGVSFAEVAVGPDEPMLEIGLDSPPMNIIFESHPEVDTIPGAVMGDRSAAPTNNGLGKEPSSGGCGSFGKVLVSECGDSTVAKLAIDGLEPPSDDIHKNESLELNLLKRTDALPESNVTNQLDKVSKTAQDLEDNFTPSQEAKGGCGIDSEGLYPSHNVAEIVKAAPSDGESKQKGVAALSRAQESTEKDVSTGLTYSARRLWAILTIIALCAVGILAMVAILDRRALNFTPVLKESHMGADLSTSFETLLLPQEEHNISTSYVPDIDTDDTDNDMQCDNDGASGSELEHGEGVSNLFNPIIKTGPSVKSWGAQDVLWAFLPTTLLSWVKLMESIAGALAIIWLFC